MNDLIERLEKATGTDKFLDTDIARLMGLAQATLNPPAYTFSIDAALTLVLEGHDWFVMCSDGALPHASVSFKGNGYHAAPEREFEASAATAGAALSAAALKARAALAHRSADD